MQKNSVYIENIFGSVVFSPHLLLFFYNCNHKNYSQLVIFHSKLNLVMDQNHIYQKRYQRFLCLHSQVYGRHLHSRYRILVLEFSVNYQNLNLIFHLIFSFNLQLLPSKLFVLRNHNNDKRLTWFKI